MPRKLAEAEAPPPRAVACQREPAARLLEEPPRERGKRGALFAADYAAREPELVACAERARAVTAHLAALHRRLRQGS